MISRPIKCHHDKHKQVRGTQIASKGKKIIIQVEKTGELLLLPRMALCKMIDPVKKIGLYEV